MCYVNISVVIQTILGLRRALSVQPIVFFPCAKKMSADIWKDREKKRFIIPGFTVEVMEKIYNMGLVARKPVFGVSDKVSFKPDSSATETS